MSQVLVKSRQFLFLNKIYTILVIVKAGKGFVGGKEKKRNKLRKRDNTHSHLRNRYFATDNQIVMKTYRHYVVMSST